jgi:hypothetical protein
LKSEKARSGKLEEQEVEEEGVYLLPEVEVDEV